MTREEARVRLSGEDQSRVNQLAARFGWSGAALTVWALAMELDGIPADVAVGMAELVAALVGTPGHDPTVRRSPSGTAYTTVTVEAGVVPNPVLVPPMPGKPTATLLVPPADQTRFLLPGEPA